MKQKITTFLSLGALAFAAYPASAHHSHAMFDNDKVISVEGTVKEFQWTNPHMWIQLLVKDPKTGNVVEWPIEGGPLGMLRRYGWTHSTFQPGDKGVFEIHPLRTGNPGGSFIKAVVGDTTVFEFPTGGGKAIFKSSELPAADVAPPIVPPSPYRP